MKRTLKFHFFDSVVSTQTTAKSLKLEADKVHVVIAFEQTGGQGTFGKPWISLKDCGLYATFAFLIDPNLSLNVLSHLAATSVAQTLDKLNPKIKWPNDILVQDKKISGVLTEIIDISAYIGIGINLQKPPLLEAQVDQPIIAWHEIESPPPLDILAQTLGLHFLNLLEIWQRQGFSGFKALYKSYSPLLNQKVLIDNPTGLDKGILIDFSDEGYPVLQIGTQEKSFPYAKKIYQDA